MQDRAVVGRRINEVQEIESYPGYTPTPPPAVPPTMDDDFDFSAGLAMLDKKKMWEHIRVSNYVFVSQLCAETENTARIFGSLKIRPTLPCDLSHTIAARARLEAVTEAARPNCCRASLS